MQIFKDAECYNLISIMDTSEETDSSLLKMIQVYKYIDKSHPDRNKIIKSILNKEINFNQVIPASVLLNYSQLNLEGCTVLHISAIESDVETFKLLLDNGADFTMQNQSGDTVLHYLFECTKDNSDTAVRNDMINAVLSAHVKFANSSNPCNSKGISHFHIACMVNDSQAVHLFLENAVSAHQSVNKDSPIFPGYSSLHFAAEGCSFDMIKLLLKQNVDISLKDVQGRTALHIFLQQKMNLFDSLKECEADVTEVILEKIDLIDDATNLLLQNDNTDDVGFSQFHNACTMRDSSVAECLVEHIPDINHHVKFDSPVWPGYTALHFASQCNMKTFQMLVQKRANIDAKNAEGLTPVDLCFRKCKSKDVMALLRCKAEWINSQFIDNKTQLITFLSAMCELLQFSSYLQVAVSDLNIQVVENPPFWVGWTPLHFVVLVSKDTNTEIIGECLKRGAKVTVQDIHGRTPIHLAFRLKKIKITGLLLDHCPSEEDLSLIDIDGLSLHLIIRQLIRHPSDFTLRHSSTAFEEIGMSCVHSASYSGDHAFLNDHLKQYPFPHLSRIINAVITCDDQTIFWSRYRGYAPLHLAIERRSNALTVELLLENAADIFATRPDGMTPIYAVLEDVSNDYVIKHFILKLKTGQDFRRTPRSSMMYLEEFSGITTLHIACRTFDVETVSSSIEKGIHVNASVNMDCPIWPNYAPLHVLIRYSAHVQDQEAYEDFQTILGILLTHGADVTAVNGEDDTPVHLSFEHCVNDISDHNFVCTSLLMDHHKDFRVNPVNAKKISHFHAACIVNNVEAVEKFLDCGVDVNEPIDFSTRNFAGESPLHLALKRIFSADDHLKTVDLLLSHGANVLAKDAYGYTVLHRAACDYSQNTKLLEKLISYGADVNAKNIFGDTPMEFLLKVNEISLAGVEILLNSGCQLNNCNHITEEGYLAMIIDDSYHKVAQAQVFEKVMNSTDLSNVDEMGRSALHNIVTACKPNVDIINYAAIIDQFEKLGINLDHQDKSGKTVLHLASQFRNSPAVAALINAGADINITDSNNKTVLSYALEPNNPNEHDDDVIKNLVAHIRKLLLLGIGVNQLNEHLLKEYNLKASFDSECLLSERENIRMEVDTEPQLLVDDFFLETDALATYPFACDLKRKKVESFFKSVTNELIELKSVLMFQYRKALKAVVVSVL